jgi:hypothetical protein
VAVGLSCLSLILPLTASVIFEQYVTSPKTAAGNIWDKQPSLDELPKLRALSDLMWAIWTRENPDTKNIRYFWVQGAFQHLPGMLLILT